jgi:hypothetical protein
LYYGNYFRGEIVAVENNEIPKIQEQYQKKFDPVRFIIAIILVGVIMIVATNFLAPPTIGNVFPTGAWYIFMSEEDYKESTTAIQGLIAGEEPDTKNLSNILSLRNQIYSFTIIKENIVKYHDKQENIVKYHDKRTHDLFCFLKLAASHAEARKLTVRYYLLRADIC